MKFANSNILECFLLPEAIRLGECLLMVWLLDFNTPRSELLPERSNIRFTRLCRIIYPLTGHCFYSKGALKDDLGVIKIGDGYPGPKSGATVRNCCPPFIQEQHSLQFSARHHVPIEDLRGNFVGENQDRRVDYRQLVLCIRQFLPQFLESSSPFLADRHNAFLPLSMLGGDRRIIRSHFLLRGIYVYSNIGGNAGSNHILSVELAGDGPCFNSFIRLLVQMVDDSSAALLSSPIAF